MNYKNEVLKQKNITILTEDTHKQTDVTFEKMYSADDYDLWGMYEKWNITIVEEQVFMYEENLKIALHDYIADIRDISKNDDSETLIKIGCWEEEEIDEIVNWETIYKESKTK
tara:strand:- start:284 stop:622 length:339 start_codon:yes stop_codon:yes gene_type:complete